MPAVLGCRGAEGALRYALFGMVFLHSTWF
jgi:hypothetical protein